MKTRQQALRDLCIVVAEIAALTAHLTPEEAAERAWFPGHPKTLERLADDIRAARSA